jgi:hypothetical protein
LEDLVTGLEFPVSQCGDVVQIGVYVDDHFDYIYNLQFSLNWNPAELEFLDIVSLPAINGDLPVTGNVPALVNDGKLTYSYTSFLSATFLADGAELLVLEFRVLEGNDDIELTITGEPMTLEAIKDPLFENVGILPVNTWSIPPVSGPEAEIATFSDLRCNNDASGAATVSVTGGNAPYQYLWDDDIFQTTQTATGLQAGTYVVTVTATGGCSTTASVTLSEPTAVLDVNSTTNKTCSGFSAGTLNLNATGGTPPYDCAWDGPATNDGTAENAVLPFVVNNLPAGSYAITVTDANGCTDTETVEIQVFAAPPAAISGPSSFCTGESATLSASGGTAYAWSTGASTATINVTSAGTYTLTVTDANGCTGTATTAVTVNTGPTVQITGDTEICSNETTSLSASSGASYLWSTGATSQAISAGAAGTYTVTVTGANSCTGTATATLSVQTAPDAVISGDPVACAGQSVTLTASGGDQLLWSTGSSAAEIVLNQGGTYSVTATNTNGCTDVASVSVNITQTTFQVEVSATPETCVGAADGAVALTITGGIQPFSYLWNNQANTSSISGLSAGAYAVTITDDVGCTQTASADVCLQCKAFAGTLRHWSDDTSRISGVSVTLGTDGSATAVTGADGQYLLTAASGANFSIVPTKTAARTAGVTSADLTRIQRHVTLIEPFQSGYQVLASDANSDRRITSLDMVIGSQCLLGNPTACNIWNAPVWRFVKADHVFPGVLSPWNPPVGITLTGVQDACDLQDGLDFVGLKSLDVVQPLIGLRPAPVVLRGTDALLEAGNILEVPIRAAEYADLRSFQLALAFDPAALQFESAEQPEGQFESPIAFGLWNTTGGEIRALQYGVSGETLTDESLLFTLRFTVMESGRWLRDVLALTEEALPAEAYTSEWVPRPFALEFTRSTRVSDASGAAQMQLTAVPNPAAGSTRLRFYLPEACEARITLTDASGRLLHEYTAAYDAGAHERRVELPASGLYLATLQTPQGVRTVKVLCGAE